MKKKLIRTIIYIVTLIVVLISAFQLIQLLYLQKELSRSNRAADENIKGLSENAMHHQAGDYLERVARIRAKAYDDNFQNFRDCVLIIAEAAGDMYAHPDSYGEDIYEAYDVTDTGDLVTYVAFGDDTDPSDPAVSGEAALLSNLQSVLGSTNRINDAMATDYFASESGLFVCAEPASEYNLPKGDAPLYFEARLRPWYTEAKAAGHPVFTGMMHDADTDEYAISCAVPVYADGEFTGVAGAGMFLNDLRADVGRFKVGENGFACVVNNYGQILFSGADSGELAASTDNDQDIRNSSNTNLAAIAKAAIDGGSGVGVIEMDGADYYVGYAPMNTVSWSYLTVLPESEIVAPAMVLLSELDETAARQGAYVRNTIIRSIGFMTLILIILCAVMYRVASKYADRISGPITTLTEKVGRLQGDDLDFEWDADTGDEVQILAEAFGSMTERMKRYISDITGITAEKERIEADLTLAAQIQASMLPSVFPPYPERKEFGLFAEMDPAKEVGGDFYDFFFVDSDHLALVIADVSGKGVPAALFMVIAMTIIENTTQAIGMVNQAFNITNNQLCEGNSEDMFVTAWMGIIDLKSGVMSWCDAGHETAYIIRADGQLEALYPRKKKMPIAAFENTSYIANEVTLLPGDSLFLYTDGVVEATDSNNELYRKERLESVLRAGKDRSPEELLKSVRADVDLFVGEAPQFDDLTMLGFKYYGVSDTEEQG